jgi:hypothetical protein
MGYYDNQQVANLTGRNAPYDVKDILLGTNAVTGGVDKLVANAAAERVSSQQDQANQYISSLLSNTNTSNYDVNMPKIRVLSQFASPQMIAQLQGLTTDINNKNNLDINQQNSNNGTITASAAMNNSVAAQQVADNGTTNSQTERQNMINTGTHMQNEDKVQSYLASLKPEEMRNALTIGLGQIGATNNATGVNLLLGKINDGTRNRALTIGANQFTDTVDVKRDLVGKGRFKTGKDGSVLDSETGKTINQNSPEYRKFVIQQMKNPNANLTNPFGIEQ